MFKKGLVFAVMVTIVSLNSYAATIDSNWIGGEWNFWENNANWSSASYPHNNSDTYNVTIDGDVNGATVKLQNFHTIDSLRTYGYVELDQWQSEWIELTVLNGVTNFGTVTIHCQIIGDVNNTSGATLDFDKHMNIFGQLYNPPGGTIRVEFEDMDIEDANIVNEGAIVAYSNGGLGEANQFLNSGNIELYGGFCHGMVFDNLGTGTIEGYGVISSDQLTRNEGLICAARGSLLVVTTGAVTNTGALANRPSASLHIKAAEDMNNFGTIEVHSGGGVAFDCNLINEPNGVISLLGGTLAATKITQTQDANFAGFGTISGNVIIEPNGLISLTGPTNIIGDVNIAENATLQISDGQTLITGHTTNDGTIHLIGGTVIFQGGYSGAGNIINEAGIDRNHFDLNADGVEDLKDFAYFAESWLWQASWY